MKFLFAFFIYLITISFQLHAQYNASTKKNESPILVGANAKVNYVSKIQTRNNIPAVLAPYVAGLIFSNATIKSDTSSIKSAVTVWMNKYLELKKKILLIPDTSRKNSCLRLLDQGDFPAVERNLQITTDYHELNKTFPEIYQTNGNQSPIIVGDYGTVTYIVDQLVTFDLPEGLTVNLLTELKLSRDTVRMQSLVVSRLTKSMLSTQSRIRDYINKYRSVVEELQKSPDSVNKRALVYFKKNQFDKALAELEKGRGSGKAYGNTQLIKAKILLLQLSNKSYDSTMEEILIAYKIATAIIPSYANLLEYGQFITDYYYKKPDLAIPVLSQALDSAATIENKIVVGNYLANAYMSTDRVKSSQIIQKTLDLLKTREPLHDSLLLVNKALLQYYLAINYSVQIFDSANFRHATYLMIDAKKTLLQVPHLSTELKFKLALINKSAAYNLNVLGDTAAAIAYYDEAIHFFEDPENANQLYMNGAVQTYMGLSLVYSGTYQYQKANDILFKTKSLIENNLNLKSQIFVQESEQVYTMIIRNLYAMFRNDEAFKYLLEFKQILLPFVNSNASMYALPLAEVNTDLGQYYLQKGDLPESKKNTNSAYEFFIQNLNTAVADKMKFQTCIYSYNGYFIAAKQIDSGIRFNKDLLKIILENEGYNPLPFGDLKTQVYFHIFQLYYTEQKDSAELYVRKTIGLSEARAKQGPLDNIIYYTNHSMGLANILIGLGRFSTLDSLSDAYVRNCLFMSGFSDFIRQRYQGGIGYWMASYGVNIGDQIDSLHVTDPESVKKCLRLQDRIFDSASRYFTSSIEEPESSNTNNNRFNYAVFLYERGIGQNHWITFSPPAELELHKRKKNDYLISAGMTLNSLPQAPVVLDLKSKIAQISN